MEATDPNFPLNDEIVDEMINRNSAINRNTIPRIVNVLSGNIDLAVKWRLFRVFRTKYSSEFCMKTHVGCFDSWIIPNNLFEMKDANFPKNRWISGITWKLWQSYHLKYQINYRIRHTEFTSDDTNLSV